MTDLQVQQKRRIGDVTFVALLILGLVVAGIVMYFALTWIIGVPLKGDSVAVVYAQGIMITGDIPSGFGYATSEDITRSIREAAEDSSVKAIVIRVNSPGGSPAAAQEIANEVRKAKAKKPVVISMGDMAASGGYYMSAPADRIVANPDTYTGSIGVIWVFTNKSGSYEKEGIDFYVAKTGRFKDMGGDWRGLSDQEKQYADQVVAEVYERFVAEVAEGRNMSVSKVKDIADGRIYTGAKAKELGLVDELGNLEEAIEIAAKLGGIAGKPNVKYINKPSWSSLLFGSRSEQNFLRYMDDSPYGRLAAIADVGQTSVW